MLKAAQLVNTSQPDLPSRDPLANSSIRLACGVRVLLLSANCPKDRNPSVRSGKAVESYAILRTRAASRFSTVHAVFWVGSSSQHMASTSKFVCSTSVP